MDTSNFPALMQRVPQPLFDDVYNMVLHVELGTRKIDNTYTFPAQLQVDRLSRRDYAYTYYGRGSTISLDRRLQQWWSQTLCLEHFDRIRNINYPLCDGNLVPGPNATSVEETMQQRLDGFEALLRGFGYRRLGERTGLWELTVQHPGC